MSFTTFLCIPVICDTSFKVIQYAGSTSAYLLKGSVTRWPLVLKLISDTSLYSHFSLEHLYLAMCTSTTLYTLPIGICLSFCSYASVYVQNCSAFRAYPKVISFLIKPVRWYSCVLWIYGFGLVPSLRTTSSIFTWVYLNPVYPDGIPIIPSSAFTFTYGDTWSEAVIKVLFIWVSCIGFRD